MKSALVNVIGIQCTGASAAFEHGTLNFGTLGSGSLTGGVTQVGGGLTVLLNTNVAPGSGLGSINATMTGATLTGTIVWTAFYEQGNGTSTIQFQAQQVIPPVTSSPSQLRRRR